MALRQSPYASFAAHLLRAMGLSSPIALAALTSACGGNVVVDPPGEGGGGAAATSSTSTQSTTSTGTPTDPCADVPLTDGRVDVCYTPMADTPCAQPTIDDVSPHLTDDQISSTVCSDFCCTTTTITTILCGPMPTSGACCYRADTQSSEICEGRPFLIFGEARTAPTAARADWRARAGAERASIPDTAALPEPARRALAAAWARDAAFEHASIASFARFVLELLAVGAPPDLLAGAQEALSDEIRHAALCFGLASAYAGAPLGPGPLPIDGALHDRRDLAAIAAAVVREGCVGETIAALAAAEARDAAKDPAVRAALERIAGDELRHAALSWRFAAWALRQGGAPLRAAFAAAFDEAARAAGGAAPAAEIGEGIDPALLSAHGRLSPAVERRVVARALTEVIRPCAAALLAETADLRLDGVPAG